MLAKHVMGPRTHGEVKRINGKRVASLEYHSWQMMKNRCLNPKSKDYPYYGGRGIRIAARWMRFEEFLADMGRRPSSKHTLERRNNNQHYERNNCYWGTRQDQARNRRKDFHTCNLGLARKIRKMYASGKYYQYEIAARFGLTQAHVSQITRNVCWAE